LITNNENDVSMLRNFFATHTTKFRTLFKYSIYLRYVFPFTPQAKRIKGSFGTALSLQKMNLSLKLPGNLSNQIDSSKQIFVGMIDYAMTCYL